MVCKKDVLSWFKTLQSYKRTDLMCSLLNLCLPVELRYLGTCLEHLGKRDFHELRQAENEVNTHPDLNPAEPQSLSNQQLRTKLAVYLSVLYSCNYSCANSIYTILMKNEDVQSLLQASEDDENALDDLLLIYILAINHPAFSFDQKLNLEKIFHRLHEEEARRLMATTKSFSPTPQEQEKTQNMTIISDLRQERKRLRSEAWKKLILKSLKGNTLGYPTCISSIDAHIIGVGPQLPNMPSTHHPGILGDQAGVVGVHDGSSGNGPLRLGFTPGAVPPPGAPGPLLLNTGAWAMIQPTTPALSGDSPMASRTSSPCSRPGSPSPTQPQPPQTQQQPRVKFPPPRVPPPGDIVRDTIGKEMPKFATHLQNFSTEQLSRMTDEELKEIGLTQCAITQLKSILTNKPVIMTNGLGGIPPPHILDVKKKMDPEQENMMRRYPMEAMAVYHSIPNTGILQQSPCYNCYAFGPRKCVPVQPYPPAGIALAPPPPPPTTLSQHLQPQVPITESMRNLRLENEQSSASDSASDHSPPDTPAPQSSDGTVMAEDRLAGNNEERRGGGHGRARGIGRNRSNPPGIQTLPRGRGPNPSHRRRDVNTNMMNGVDDRKVYQGGNGSGNSTGGNGGDPGGAPGYFSFMGPYIRPTYHAAYHHPAAYVRYPTAYNGDVVYQYPGGPPPGANPGTFLAPHPSSYSAVTPPPQQPLPPPSQLMKSPSCYNCGSQSHGATDCPDPTIEEVTKQGQYRIDVTSFQKSPPAEIPGTADK